jgi:hypothetical protein
LRCPRSGGLLHQLIAPVGRNAPLRKDIAEIAVIACEDCERSRSPIEFEGCGRSLNRDRYLGDVELCVSKQYPDVGVGREGRETRHELIAFMECVSLLLLHRLARLN